VQAEIAGAVVLPDLAWLVACRLLHADEDVQVAIAIEVGEPGRGGVGVVAGVGV